MALYIALRLDHVNWWESQANLRLKYRVRLTRDNPRPGLTPATRQVTSATRSSPSRRGCPVRLGHPGNR